MTKIQDQLAKNALRRLILSEKAKESPRTKTKHVVKTWQKRMVMD